MSKIVFGVLRERQASWMFVDCLMAMMAYTKTHGHDYVYNGLRATNIYKGREHIANTFLKEKADFLFFVDSDEVFSPNVAVHLAALDLPVVSGVVYMRDYPYAPCIYRRLPNSDLHLPLAPELQTWFKEHQEQVDKRTYSVSILDDISRDEALWEIDECGTGCMMIRRDVIEAMTPPFFRGMGDIGTDVMFCRRVREAGFSIYADLRVQLGHLQEYPVSMNDFLAIEKWNVQWPDEVKEGEKI